MLKIRSQRIKFYLSALLLCLSVLPASSIDKQSIVLNEAVNRLALESPEAKVLALNFKNQQLQYDNFKKSYLPSVSFSLSPISFNRSLKLLQQPSDGSYTYVEDFSNNSNAGINIQQKVGFTGGEIQAGSSLNYLKELSNDRSSFSTSPYFIGYSQQLWGGGKLDRWEREAAEIRHQQAAKQFCYEISSIQQRALGYFMELFFARLECEAAQVNLNQADTMLRISELRLQSVGITEYDFKQVEIDFSNSRYRYETSLKNRRTASKNFQVFLGQAGADENLQAETPTFDLPLLLDKKLIMHYVQKNNPEILGEKLRKIENERELFSIRLNNSGNANISLNYGVNQFAPRFIEAYRHPDKRQSVSVSVQLPIWQWGINKNKLKIAENNYEASQIEMEKSRLEFDNRLDELVNGYNLQAAMWEIAEKSYRLSQEQLILTAEKFRLGKISVYELFSAKDQLTTAMQRYYAAIRDTYSSYYALRTMALYDFKEGVELEEILVSKND